MKRFIKRFNEFLGIPLAVVLYFITPPILRWVDPTAGAYDAGYLHAIALGLVKIFFASGVAWLLMWATFPKFYRYLDDDAETDLLNGTAAHHAWRAGIAFLIWAVYFITMVVSFSPE